MSQGLGTYAQRIGASPRLQVWKYAGWAKGENNFAEDNEIRSDEFYEGENVEVTGKASVSLPRRGRELFAQLDDATFNGWGIYKDPATGTNLLVVLIGGRLYKITTAGTITEIDNTETWDASAKMRGVLLRGWFYFGNATDYMAKTDGSTIVRWDAVTAITGFGVVKTGAGTDTLFAYTVTAVTDVGETEAIAEVSDYHTTLDATHYFTLTWDRKTDANVVGYNVYKAVSGSTLRLLTFVDQQTSGATISYVDNGVDELSLIYEAPDFNTTGGVKGNIFAKYANTLFVSGNAEVPDAVFYGGTGSKWESFNPSDNGGWVIPGRGDGEKVTAMIGFEDYLFIFKENSIWKFFFASDGAPQLVSVIPQYGTSSPDTVWRMEKDVIFFGSDGRIRILGYEPTQLNVIRTADISNRIQPRLDAIDKSQPENIFAAFFEQKFILCDATNAYPYDRRYVGFLGKWTNQDFDSFIVWDKGTGQQKLFGIETGTGKLYQVLVDNVYSDDGAAIPALFRVKRIDGGEDTILKYYYFTKIKFKNAKGKVTIRTFKDGEVEVDETPVSFEGGGGIDEYMWDEPMWDEQIEALESADTISILIKDLEFEAYSIYHQIEVSGTNDNRCVVQTMNGVYEVEDIDYRRDEKVI